MFEREADTSRVELNTLMGRSPDEPLEIQGEHTVIAQLPSQEELLSIALRSRPELLALEVMKKQGSRKMHLAEKGTKPDYSISAGYMLMPAGSMNRNGLIAEFSMTLPWLNRGKHDSEVDQAQAESASVQAEYQRQLATISREIREALIRAESARKVVDLYRTTLRPDIQILSRAATVAYETNQAGLLGILGTQSTSIDAEYALLDALAEYEQSIAALERAIGAPLSERNPL
jgi:outer membrane protein, heavy metal efflux system